MAAILFGIETEYALASPACPASDQPVQDVLKRLMARARETLVQLPAPSAGMFVGNGGRLYVDCGGHPEFATPECDNPWDLVRYVLAGDRILVSLAAAVESSMPAASEVALFKGNVDLSGNETTWGCHESYLHTMPPAKLADQIIPHLVSRVIYTGAGGFDPLSPTLEFSVSPRVAHITCTNSPHSTSNRGIYHTKDEPLANQYSRLHVLCGESLCSHLASWLKVGTTAVVVAMSNAGLRPGKAIPLRAPLTALRTFAADPTCTAEVALADGRMVTARAIQEAYLAQAEAHLGNQCMPPWARDVCREWRAMLARLAGAPASVDRTLDWAIKWSLYDARVRRAGFTWERLAKCRVIATHLGAALRRCDHSKGRVRIEFLLGDESPIRQDVERMRSEVRRMGLDWSDLIDLFRLRRELFEIDTRFAQLGDRGVFTSLDRAGVLRHEVTGIDRIDDAEHQPPAGGRAHVRGAAVQRLSGRPGWTCDWEGVWDPEHGSPALDLSDPFETNQQWRWDPQQPLGPRGAAKRPASGHGAGRVRDRIPLVELLQDWF